MGENLRAGLDDARAVAAAWRPSRPTSSCRCRSRSSSRAPPDVAQLRELYTRYELRGAAAAAGGRRDGQRAGRPRATAPPPAAPATPAAAAATSPTRRATTRPSPAGRTSSAGWRRSRARRAVRLRHRDHQPRLHARRDRRRVLLHRAGHGRLRAAAPRLCGRARRSSTARGCSRRSSRCSRIRRAASSATTSSTTRTCSPTTASRSPACASTPCSSPTCWNSVATRHDMDVDGAALPGLRTISYEEVAGKGAQADLLRPGAASTRPREYAAEDADVTLRLHRALWPQLERVPALAQLYEEIEQPLVPVLLAHGAPRRADRPRAAARAEPRARAPAAGAAAAGAPRGRPRIQHRVAQAAAADPVRASCSCRCGARPRPGSPRPPRTCWRSWPTSYALPRIVLEYRALAKLKSTYTDKLPEQVNERTGRIHTYYHQAVAATGRLSSVDPNLQNIPIRRPEGRRIRQAFIAPAGLRAAGGRLLADRAAHHGAPVRATRACCAAFAEDRDVHRATAAEVFGVGARRGHRRPAPHRQGHQLRAHLRHVAVRPGAQPRHRARRGAAVRRALLPALPGREALHGRDARAARARAATSRRCSGGACTCRTSAPATPQLRQYAERSAINAPMQGTAADIIKRAMISRRCLVRTRRLPRRASSCRCTMSWCSRCARGRGRRGERGGARAHGERRRR